MPSERRALDVVLLRAVVVILTGQHADLDDAALAGAKKARVHGGGFERGVVGVDGGAPDRLIVAAADREAQRLADVIAEERHAHGLVASRQSVVDEISRERRRHGRHTLLQRAHVGGNRRGLFRAAGVAIGELQRAQLLDD